MAYSRQALLIHGSVFTCGLTELIPNVKREGRPEPNVSESSRRPLVETTANSKDLGSLLLGIVMNYLYEGDPGAGIAFFLALMLSLFRGADETSVWNARTS